MTHLRCAISEFLKDSRRLFSGIAEDPFIRERLRAYNYTDQRLAQAAALLEKTEKAESGKDQGAGQWIEAGRKADRLIAGADTAARRHYDFLKLALRKTPGKMEKIFTGGVPNYNKLRLADWFMRVKNLYRRVLADEEVVLQLGIYAVTRRELTGTLEKVIEAEKAKDAQHRQKGATRDATMARNRLLDRLRDAVRELRVICTYALEDRPQLMEKLGGKGLTPGYKPRKKALAGGKRLPRVENRSCGWGMTLAGAGRTPARAGATPAGAVTIPACAGRTPARAETISAGAGTTPAGAETIPARAGMTLAGAATTPAGAGMTLAGAGKVPAGDSAAFVRTGRANHACLSP